MATRKFFKCNRPQCQRKDHGNFWSEVWTCPQCLLNEKDQRFGFLIQRLVVVHFDPPTDIPGLGWHHRACDVERDIGVVEVQGIPNPWHAGTGVASQVNCEACMKTNVYKLAIEAVWNDDEADPKTLSAIVQASIERIEMAALAKK